MPDKEELRLFKTTRRSSMTTLFSVITTVVVLGALIVHVISVLLYARSEDWKIQQRLQRYAGK
jgi:hypothetical protein